MKKPSRPQSCSLLRMEESSARVWSFSTGGAKVELVADKTFAPAEPLPPRLVAKSWREFLQPRLNIAWLPPESVFLRVLQLPTTERAEVQPMVEFQIEKLSPLPLGQVVWSYEVLPRGSENALTVVVAIASRHAVEAFLGGIEARGYQPDRLELSLVAELFHAPPAGDGVYLHVRELAEGFTCTAVWWSGGILRDVVMSRLPKDASAKDLLQDQLSIMTWTGELNGWTSGPPAVRVMAAAPVAVAFQAATGLDTQVEVVAPEPPASLAQRAVAQAAAGDARLNLLPPDRAVRYRQQWIDRTWMSALGALVLAYVFGVVLYLAGVEFAKLRRADVEQELNLAGGPYTNAMQLRAKVGVLQEQLDLKFAALESLGLVARNLPGELRLSSFSFSRGKSVTLFGEGPVNSIGALTEYNRKLVNAALGTNAEPFFTEVRPPSSSTRAGPQGEVLAWSFTADIRRAEP